MRLLLIVLLYISALGWTWGDSLASKNNEGNRLYEEGKIDEAMSKWRDGQIENPDSDKLHYNIGNGLHGQKKYDDAFKEYEKSLDSKDSGLQQKAYYNMGNTHYKMGKLLEAIEDYKKCLDINSNDEDAKYNIEFIRKKIKENMKKENEQQDEKKDQGSAGAEKQEEDQKEQGKEDQSQQEKDRQKAQEENKENQEEKKEGQEAKEQQGSSGEEKKDDMSKEDAMRLLDALKDDEKDLQKELQNQPGEGRYRVEKDW